MTVGSGSRSGDDALVPNFKSGGNSQSGGGRFKKSGRLLSMGSFKQSGAAGLDPENFRSSQSDGPGKSGIGLCGSRPSGTLRSMQGRGKLTDSPFKLSDLRHRSHVSCNGSRTAAGKLGIFPSADVSSKGSTIPKLKKSLSGHCDTQPMTLTRGSGNGVSCNEVSINDVSYSIMSGKGLSNKYVSDNGLSGNEISENIISSKGMSDEVPDKVVHKDMSDKRVSGSRIFGREVPNKDMPGNSVFVNGRSCMSGNRNRGESVVPAKGNITSDNDVSSEEVSGRAVSGLRSRPVPEWAVMLLLSAFASGCYFNSLHGDFVHDDLVAVSGNPDVTGQSGWTALLRNDFWGRPMADPTSHKSYRPVTVLTFRLNWAVFGSGVLSFHAINVLLHCSAACLLLRFCTEGMGWGRDAALFASLLFAAHPVHTEAVSNVVGRADVLCCVFYLASLIACSRDSLCWQLASWCLACLALFAKEQGITVLGACFVHHALLFIAHRTNPLLRADAESGCKQRRCRLMDNGAALKILARMAGLVAVAAALCYLRVGVINGPLPQFSEHDNPAAFAKPWTTRFLTYLYLPAFNLWLLLCPSVLSYDWQMGSLPLVETLADPRNAASAAYLLLLSLLLIHGSSRSQWRERRGVLLPVSVAAFSFLPASNLLVTVGFVAAERVLYIPSVGFCLLVSHGLQRLMQRGGAAVAWMCRLGALLLILLFVLKTVTRNNVWANREALLRSGLESVPHNAKVHYNYANYKKDVGDKRTAVEHYRTAIRLWPTYYTAHNNLGTLLEDGEDHFRQAIAINPYYAKAYYNLASLYVRRGGRTKEAESLLLRALRLHPEFVSALSSLASLYAGEAGREGEAERLYKWAVALDPQDADVRNNYGYFLETHGRAAEALGQYERAMAAQPNHTVAILNAARSLRAPEHSGRAEELYKRALSIQEDPQVLENLAALYFSSGRHREARDAYEAILARHPTRNDSKMHYAQLLIQERSFDRAEELLLPLAPHHTESLLHLATLYSRTNRTEEALDTILRALRQCSGSESGCAKFHEEHGDILKDMDDYDAAEQSYRLALDLDPKLPKTHQNLAVIYHIKGNYSSAEHHYREAYKLDSSPRVLLDNMAKLRRTTTTTFGQEDRWRTTADCRGLQ